MGKREKYRRRKKDREKYRRRNKESEKEKEGLANREPENREKSGEKYKANYDDEGMDGI